MFKNKKEEEKIISDEKPTMNVIRKISEDNYFDFPLVNNTKHEYDEKTTELITRFNPSSEPLNAQTRMMISSMENAEKFYDCQNTDFMYSLHSLSNRLITDNFANYIIDSCFVNFCNMIDQLIGTCTSENSKYILNRLQIKSILYEMINDFSVKVDIKSIINVYFGSPHSAGNMIMWDTARNNPKTFNEYELFIRYIISILGVQVYSIYCHAIQKAVDEVYLNVYQCVDYDRLIEKAAEEMRFDDCPKTLQPMYISNYIKQYLLMNTNMLMKFLNDNVFGPAFDKIYSTAYYNFGLTGNMIKERRAEENGIKKFDGKIIQDGGCNNPNNCNGCPDFEECNGCPSPF